MASSGSGNYLLFNLHRGLLRYTADDRLVPDGAKSCAREGMTIVCELDPSRRWSDGTSIRADHYVRAFRRLIDPKTASPQADTLFTVLNARAIARGEISPERLGVYADHPLKLRIELAEVDPEFEHRLAQSALSPLPAKGFETPKTASRQVTSGPYMIAEWKPGKWIDLVSNPYYAGARPPVRVLFIEDDLTAARLYETGRLKFLRRIPNQNLKRLSRRPGFKRIPMARFDYIGFGPELAGHADHRTALTQAVRFDQFLKLMDTLSPPGCPSLPARMFDKPICQKPDLKAAEAAWKKKPLPVKLEFHFSQLGGDDIARGAEWVQNQWKRNLNVQVDLKAQEQGVYLNLLKTNPPPIFRKGVNLDRATCLAGLELFTSAHPENYIRLRDKKFDHLVTAVRTAHGPDRKRACREAMEHLLATRRMIPLGEMYFSVLASPEFTGWTLNSLNQLDLGLLAVRTPQP